jgi:transposase
MAPALIEAIGRVARLLADKAYDTNPFRAVLAGRAIEPVIPSIRRRKPLIPYDAAAYRQRNLIERMFCRLKDFRRLATRYDKLARNFLATAILAAIVIWWIN